MQKIQHSKPKIASKVQLHQKKACAAMIFSIFQLLAAFKKPQFVKTNHHLVVEVFERMFTTKTLMCI